MQPVAVQSKPKRCRMQEGDARTMSLYIPPIRPLSAKLISLISNCSFGAAEHTLVLSTHSWSTGKVNSDETSIWEAMRMVVDSLSHHLNGSLITF